MRGVGGGFGELINIQDVYYTYPNGVEALRGVSLEIQDGEFVAIMGQNGAGKTTLVKHINGLLKPAKGTVTIDELETTKASVATLSKKVGFVFQNPDHQLFSETVEDEVSFALKNFGYDEKMVKERVDWALNLLDLAEYRKVSPFMLSGGERKRVALALVLAWHPKIVILDEPTIGQDNQQKERLRQFIMQLRQQEKTVIIVTHDIEFVAECNPRIVLMAQGKIVAKGEARDILTNEELVSQASVILPEIAQIFNRLKEKGLPREVIDVYDASKILLERLGEPA
jgi:energy-coupling factor transport system ATP-binding protein